VGTIVTDNLRILMLEDSPSDAKLIQHTLSKDGVKFDAQVVDTEEDFVNALMNFKPHVVLSDHTLAGFDSMEALRIVQRMEIDVPFILVTGTVSEEFAVSVIKAGAVDYILKSNLPRLTVAILSALSQQQDRKRLKESEEQFQRTIDGMVEGVQIIGYDWRYLYVNNIVADQSKIGRDDLIGKTMMEAFPGIEASPMFSELKRCMENREQVEMENEWMYNDGSKAWFKLIMQPASPGVLILSRDITQEKNMIQLLESQNKRIKMVNSALDRFLYSVSHEFRTPICNGLGLINLLRTNLDTKDRDIVLDKLEESIRNLDELLQNIGVYSEISSLETTKDAVDFRRLFNDCLDQLKHMEGRDDVNLMLTLKEDALFYSDRKRLMIIMGNLLSNGIQFRDPRRKSFVEVVVVINSAAAHMEIRDNGIGIKEEYLDKIFEVFNTGGTTSKGRGLGLFMAREIVEKLGGNFSVKSQRDSGTTFYITIPNGNASLN
jgi:PAS domain S-box-containing protein